MTATELDNMEVDDLIELAQADLIGHRHGLAVTKLERAVVLGSSAACEVLANLLSRGLSGTTVATGYQPPTPLGSSFLSSASYFSPRTTAASSASDPQTPTTPNSSSNPLTPAHLYIRGLEIELAKPTRLGRAADDPRRGGSSMSDDRSRPWIPLRSTSTSLDIHCNEFDDEDEVDGNDGIEGRTFSLAKALDLVVGLTDQYRYGRMRSDHDDPTYPNIWLRGACVAGLAVLHPEITSTRITELVAPVAGPAHSLDRPLTPSLVFATHPVAQVIEEAKRQPGLPLKARTMTTSSQNRPNAVPLHHKMRLTLQVHLLYLLALQTWPHNQAQAERHWTEIIEMSRRNGGSVGTKAGDEIIANAAKRLARESGFQSWKREKNTSPGSLQSNVSLNASASSSAPSFACDDLGTTRGDPKPSQSAFAKFHFAARSSGYPSPPDSDEGSTLQSRSDSTAPPSSTPKPAVAFLGSGTPPLATPRSIRRVESSASLSFAPPRLLRRVASSASISTVPPNFGRPHRLEGPIWATTRDTTVAPDLKHQASGVLRSTGEIELVRPSAPARASTWTGVLRRQVSGLSMSSLFYSNPTAASRTSATSLLRQVLKKDESALASAMMWEDSDMFEDECDPVTYTPPTSSQGSPIVQASRENSRERSILSRHRSFVTLSAAETAATGFTSGDRSPPRDIPTSSIICTITPPTPTKEHLLPPRPPRRSRSSRSLRRSSLSRMTAATAADVILSSPRNSNQSPILAPIDPFLLELERNSRVGVATICNGCGSNGLNYSACPRCEKRYCGRSCRVGPTGKHVC